jgi:glutamine synthetase
MNHNGAHEHVARITELCERHSIHTIELAIPDTYGHLRGRRVPTQRFLSSLALGGLHVADAIFVFDIQCAIVDSPIINMESGFLDCHLECDLASFRLLPQRPGYAIVFTNAFGPDHLHHPLDTRSILQRQVDRCRALGFEPIAATELEVYICTSDWKPYQNHVQYSSLTDAQGLEDIVVQIRHAMLGAGIPLESSNPEYGPGQLEINFGPADPVTTADNTVLFKSIVKEVCVRNGVRASFMPKPWSGESGSGMHIHTSLSKNGDNVFGAEGDSLNAVFSHWVAGLLHHATALQLIGIPTPNGYRRVREYSFCPTHVHWGDDNRTVLARCTSHLGKANRVEYRAAGADANPYTAIAAILAAGCDGIERSLPLPAKAVGDQYTNPGDAVALPRSMREALDAFRGSALAEMLGATFSENFIVMSENELLVTADWFEGDPDAVTDSERARYLEHT